MTLPPVSMRQSYPRTFWLWLVSLFSHSVFTELYMTLHCRSTLPSFPVHPRIEACRSRNAVPEASDIGLLFCPLG